MNSCRCKRCRKDDEKQKLWSEITLRVRRSLEELKAQSETNQAADNLAKAT